MSAGVIPMLDGLQIRQLQLTKSEVKVRSAHHLPQTLLQIHRILQVAVVAAGKDSSSRLIHSYTISRPSSYAGGNTAETEADPENKTH
jgi:hypothetical protein